MKRLQALLAISCAVTVLATGIVPIGTVSLDSYAAETEIISETGSEEDVSAPTEEGEIDSVVEASGEAEAVEDTDISEEAEDSTETEVEIITVDSYTEVQEIAPADLDTASSYKVDLSSGEAEGSNDETVSVEEAFGIEEQDSADAMLDAIQDTDVYIVDEEQTDAETAVVYSPYARHRILVYTSDEVADVFGATDAAYLIDDGAYRLCYESDEATKEAYDALVEEYGVDEVVLDLPVSVSAVDAQPKGWGTSYMHLDGISQKAQNDGVTKSVTVAILDSGIKSDHEVFKGKTISPKSTSLVGSSYADDNGHGTAVAGIIAESTSDNVVLMPIKIADEKGESSLDYMLQGLKYAADNGADVVNLSMNACYTDTTLTDAQIQTDIATLEKMLQSYTSNGMVICVSAGNDGRDINATYNYPAMSDYVLSVGSIDSSEKKSSFSSYGAALDFVAPGEGVECAWNTGTASWKALSGTSMAAPYVTASCAMVISTSSLKGMNAVEQNMASFTKDLGEVGKDTVFGYGVPIFDETASYTGDQGSAQSGNATLVDGTTLPDGWEVNDPGTYKAFDQLYGSTDEEMKYVDGKLSVSSTVLKTSWRIYDKNKYNASTKTHSGSTFATFEHDSKNASGKSITPIIDVSYHNDSASSSTDDINWAMVKAEGVQGVMIRCGYRSMDDEGEVRPDVQFINFIKGAKAAGLKVGVYFFSQAITNEEGKEEAEYTLARIKESGVQLDLPVVIDVEYEYYSDGSSGRLAKANISKSAKTSIADAFCARIKQEGYTPMIYASSAFLVKDINGEALSAKGYPIWMARYRYAAYSSSTNFYNQPVMIWQCSSSAAVNGIKTAVDLNYWYSDNGGWVYDGKGWSWKVNGSIVKSKWLQNGGTWYYLNADGYMATNTWVKDSHDWCYLGSDGTLTRNKWVQRNGEWYYLNSSGYPRTNAWAKDSHGWCYMGVDGKMVYRKWIYYKNEWYYINASGYMAANEWAKDSHGWCYMGADGKIVKKKWIKWNGEWYYEKANGYMAANEWAKDSKGWCYLRSNGKIQKNKWIKWKGDWYYLKANGYMAASEYASDSKYRYWMGSNGKISKTYSK